MNVTRHVLSMATSAMIFSFSISSAISADSSSIAPPPLPPPAVTAANPPAVTAANQLPDVIATVNGVAISAAELRRANKVIQSSQQGTKLNPEQQKELEKQAVTQLISAELLYQAGSKLEVKDIEKQIEDKITQGKAKFGKPEDFTKAIKELDMTEADLRDYTRKDLIITNFVEKNIIPKVVVTEADARTFYDQNADKFKRGETLRASHILIGVDSKTTPEDKKKAFEKAKKIRKDLAGGADFATLAKEQSTCPSSKQGGDLGYFEKGQMVQPFEVAAFALKPGELSDVVETKFGYHVIKLLEKKPEEAIPFSAARPRIEGYLKNQKTSGAVGEFLNEVRKNSKIEIFYK